MVDYWEYKTIEYTLGRDSECWLRYDDSVVQIRAKTVNTKPDNLPDFVAGGAISTYTIGDTKLVEGVKRSLRGDIQEGVENYYSGKDYMIIISADDWEMLYVDGKLVDEGHNLHEGEHWLIYAKQLFNKYGNLDCRREQLNSEGMKLLEETGRSIWKTYEEIQPFIQ